MKSGIDRSSLVLVSVMLWVSSTPSKSDERQFANKPRVVQCLIEIKGKHMWGGECSFLRIDSRGSFVIVGDHSIRAQVDVSTDEDGGSLGSWSKLAVGTVQPTFVHGLDSRHKGCWSDGSDQATVICAWSRDAHIYLGPTPRASDLGDIAWGERLGMNVHVLKRSGIDTANAMIEAEKDRNGAIIWCRSNGDYTKHCIDDTLDGYSVPRRAIMHANCRTKRFIDFRGEDRKYLGQNRMLDIATQEEFSDGSAANWGASYTAIRALCPKTLETPASSK